MSNYSLQVPNKLQLEPAGDIEINPGGDIAFQADPTFTGGATVANWRSELGLEIGADVQAYDAQLADLAGLAVTNSNFIVGDGTNWVAETGATARTSLGLGSLATASTINNGDWSGTDLAVANGGTGSSSAGDARTALGLAIGSDVQAYDTNLRDLSDMTAPGAGQDGYVVSWDDGAGAFAMIEDTGETYTAGNGLALSGGNEFTIDTSITADLSTAQTLDSKTLTGVVSAEYDSGNSAGTSNNVANYLATSNNTATAIHTNTMGGTTNKDACIVVKAQVVCMNQDDQNVNAYTILAVIKRAGEESTSEVLLANVEESEETAGYSCDVAADTTNGGYKINVVGDATDSVKWVSYVSETVLSENS